MIYYYHENSDIIKKTVSRYDQEDVPNPSNREDFHKSNKIRKGDLLA